MKNFILSDLGKISLAMIYFIVVAILQIEQEPKNIAFILGAIGLMVAFSVKPKGIISEATIDTIKIPDETIKIPTEDMQEALVTDALIKAKLKAEADAKISNNTKQKSNNNNNKKPQKVMNGRKENTNKNNNHKHPNQYTKKTK